ncbi:hypothetical protein RASY3_02750 [Ruminococcus albus SY3]|uniref:Uncharacterized protein n=1 Tax=Ruminococcus albus SY3 TaxID=1341156 RepID=A0A011W0D8_RUMAL|nr:hypothetical protein [Ruminococcus albus]EXM41016.1 hypothetical protein RASY3_02750 [Ruminococcus albus SY3]
MSSRKKITDFLSRLLEKEKFTGMGKYWGKEVVVDYGTEDIRRIQQAERHIYLNKDKYEERDKKTL